MAIMLNNPPGENPLIPPVPITDVHVNQAAYNIQVVADRWIRGAENRIVNGETQENRFYRIENARVRANLAAEYFNRALANPLDVAPEGLDEEVLLAGHAARVREWSGLNGHASWLPYTFGNRLEHENW